MTNLKRGRSRRHKLAVGISAMLLSAALFAQTLDFNIPSGDLKAALDAYATATKQQIIYNDADLRGRTSKGAKGAMTPETALKKVLEGTNLNLRRDGSGAVVIFLGEARAASDFQGNTVRLENVSIVSSLSVLGDVSRSGTRMDMDPMTVPLTSTSVSKDLLFQQQAKDLADAVSNVAGVVDLTGSSAFAIRGFGAGVMRNGNLQLTSEGSGAPLVAYSKVEVVKGPEAIIGGVQAGYGGVVNLITKTPDAKPITEFVSSVASRGYYELGFDINRSVSDDNSVLVRLIGAKQGSGQTIAGYDGSNSQYLAPEITIRNKSTGTELTAQYEYQSQRKRPDQIAISTGTVLTDDAPILRLDPTSNGIQTDSRITTVALNQRIGEDSELSLKYSNDQRTNAVYGSSVLPGTYFGFPATSLIVQGFNTNSTYNNITTKLEFKTEFETGPLTHRFLAAYDQLRSDIAVANQQLTLSSYDTIKSTSTDLAPIFGPMLGGLPGPVLRGGGAPTETGRLLMDQITWDKWIALLGYRWVHYEANNIRATIKESDKSLPSLGVLYRASPTLSFYANSSQGFTPNIGNFSFNGSPVDPEDAAQFELGVKATSADKKLTGTVSLFNIQQKNVAVRDITHPGATDCLGSVCYVTVDGVRSRGLEVEFSGEIAPGLGLRANYTYMNKSADRPDALGVVYVKNEANAWLIYRLNGGEKGGWWVGGGFQTRSDTLGVLKPFYYDNPGRSRIDLSMGYDATNWSIVTGVKNLTDRRIYPVGTGVFGQGAVVQPRELNVSFRYNF